MDQSDIDDLDLTPTEEGIIEMLKEGRCTPSYLAEELDVTPEYVRGRLRDLYRLGAIEKVHRGLYEIPNED